MNLKVKNKVGMYGRQSVNEISGQCVAANQLHSVFNPTRGTVQQLCSGR